MQQKSTRRGKTQENKNVVINKSHSRGILSGISLIPSRCSDLIKTNALCYNNTDAGDPRLQASGMTALYNNGLMAHGFTLIELLVVVLIIAVLAAVALPQYNKAVKKAQGREVIAAFDILDKALHSYYLEHDTYEGISVDKLNIDMPALKYFRYSVGSCSLNGQTSQLTEDELVAQQRGPYTFEVNPFLCMSNIAVDGRWKDGKAVSFRCYDYSGPNWCHEYFDCKGERTYQPQVTSTIHDKEVILQEGHYVGSCVLNIHQ